MDSSWFSPAKTRINAALVKALGRSRAAPYLIHRVGKRREGWFVIGLNPHDIHTLKATSILTITEEHGDNTRSSGV